VRKAQYFRNKNFLLENPCGTGLQQVPDFAAGAFRLERSTCTGTYDYHVLLLVLLALIRGARPLLSSSVVC
jgi:hypothetical protein